MIFWREVEYPNSVSRFDLMNLMNKKALHELVLWHLLQQLFYAHHTHPRSPSRASSSSCHVFRIEFGLSIALSLSTTVRCHSFALVEQWSWDNVTAVQPYSRVTFQVIRSRTILVQLDFLQSSQQREAPILRISHTFMNLTCVNGTKTKIVNRLAMVHSRVI